MPLKISILTALLAIFTLAETFGIKQENSLAPPYTAEAENLMFWDLTGSAQLGLHYVRLTPDESGRKGSIWNNFPCISNNWEFQVHFHIHGKGAYLHGDGMALWFVRDPLSSGPVFGSKDFFSGLGVFIDTFENDPKSHRHPYVSAMVNNGTLHYEHSEDGAMTQVGGCYMPARNMDVPTRVAVSYINNNLGVYIDFEGRGEWKPCFKSEGVHLPTGYYIGVSASTSDVTDNHDVISITTLTVDPPDRKWVDKSHIIPFAENVEISPRYHKAVPEEFLQKIDKKREMHEEEEEEDDDDDEAEEEEEKIHETKKTDATEEISTSSSTSLFTKLIYIAGAGIIVMILISIYRRYAERRRERMQKRLF